MAASRGTACLAGEAVMPVPALFLDRDGVINVDRDYVYRIEDFEFIDGIFDLCQVASACGFRLVVITNQSGIARGYYTENQFAELTDWMLDQFAARGIERPNVYHCPHHPTGVVAAYRRLCDCRKPEPGLLLRAAHELSLDLSASVLIGDKERDLVAGRRAGVGRVFKFDPDGQSCAYFTALFSGLRVG